MPLGEIVIDFYDKLKSISKGYASFDYHASGFRPSKLIKLDILLNGEPVDALSTLTHFDNAYDLGHRVTVVTSVVRENCWRSRKEERNV